MTENSEQDDKTQSHIILSKGMMVSHYRMVEKIGAGGMGEVYLVEDTKLNRKVALKFLPSHLSQNEDAKARFTREAQAAAKLKHPNIVTIYEVSEYKGRPFFAMEHIEGDSLRDLIKDQKLGFDDIIKLSLQICEGLQEAHGADIVHRDIKPSNIILDKNGRPKLADFGLVAIAGGEQLTQTGSTLGTIGYMSPEQIQVDKVDQRSDLFSFGVILYEMIAGRLPFKGDTEAATMNAVLNDTPEPLSRFKSGVSGELQRIVSKLLDKDIETRYQTAAGVISDLKQILKETDPNQISKPAISATKRYNKFLIPVLIVIIAVAILIFKPWKFEISPRQEAIAQENRLAIMYFDNLADPEDSLKLGEITANLLITDLSESEYVQVVSSQRLYDILKQLGHEGEKNISRNIATQVAKKANAKSMLLGSILNMEPEIILTAQIIDVESGDAIASQRIEGQPGDRIFPLVDKLTVEIKNDLSLPAQALSEEDPEISELTTSSVEAYRYLLEGMEYQQKLYSDDAEECYRKALTYDSTFAMAYLALLIHTEGDERDTILYKMNLYSGKASSLEKLYIKAFDAYYREDYPDYENYIKYLTEIIEKYPEEKIAKSILGDYYNENKRDTEKAKSHYWEVIQLDPLFGPVYNRLAYIYNSQYKYDSAIWAINKYIEVADPDEANPYDTRADLYAYNGKLEQAIESYEKALEIKPDFYASRLKLGYLYLFNKEYDKAEIFYRQLCSDSNAFRRSLGRMLLSYIPIYQGKFTEALKLLDDAMAADRIEQGDYAGADLRFIKANIYEARKEWKMALKEAERAIKDYSDAHPDDWIYFRHEYILPLSWDKDFAKAQKEAEIFKKDIEKNDSSTIWAYWYAVGHIEFAKGNYEQSVVCYEKAAKDVTHFQVHYMLGRAYLMSGRLGESVTQLEKTINRFDVGRVGVITMAVKIYYYLGLAYEESGWDARAIEQYETFLDIWKNADPGIEEVEDARARLARLKGGS
ncbi:MAG: FlgO family outer membrane protein [candidate division Zixibacteria bacterium]